MADAAMEPTVVLSSAVAGPGEQRFALAVIVVSTLVFLVLAPFAQVPLQPMPVFIPIYQSALVINDLITACSCSASAIPAAPAR